MSDQASGQQAEPREWFRLIGSADDDPLEVLRVVGTYQRYLAAIEERAVVTAKGMGRTWKEISDALGVKRQSAWARFGPKVTDMSAQVGTIRRLLPHPHDPTVIAIQCSNCGSLKLLDVRWQDDVAWVTDEGTPGQEVDLPGEVAWTCPICKRQRRWLLEPPPRPE